MASICIRSTLPVTESAVLPFPYRPLVEPRKKPRADSIRPRLFGCFVGRHSMGEPLPIDIRMDIIAKSAPLMVCGNQFIAFFLL
ncbi:MAG: hypothetical protein LJE65_07525 [Desulfobacteraceae bacterium]|nr:hypothetical protein [Desulfobacteraceae bacterium]